MPSRQFIEEDFVSVREKASSKSKRIVTLVFGDPVEVLGTKDGFTHIRVLSYFGGPFEGFVKGNLPVRDKGVLKFSMVDVQQGDGMVIETPEGRIMFIDGGDNKLFARHVAARFRHRQSSKDDPLEIDAMLITHGDGDHFDGLNDIARSEKLPKKKQHKRFFIHPRRIFHNGLCKGPSSLKDAEMFGQTATTADGLFAVDLFDDTRDAPVSLQNKFFKSWHGSIDHWETRGPITMKRLAHGMNEKKAFDFLFDEDVQIELQGPFTTKVKHPTTGKRVDALRFLPAPEKSAVMHLEEGGEDGGSPSASHTINGHSIAMRLTYGNVRFNLTGDLNRDSMQIVLDNLSPDQLEAEIVKAPHHGSADFGFKTLQAMKPVVAICSSGDESAVKEHIHPRATLMAALGKVMRGNDGVVFCTELAAFFAIKKESYTVKDLKTFFNSQKTKTFTGAEIAKLLGKSEKDGGPPGQFFGFQRTNFGIVHIHTDGERVLVYTHSGKKGLNEAYRFRVTVKDGKRTVKFDKKVKTR